MIENSSMEFIDPLIDINIGIFWWVFECDEFLLHVYITGEVMVLGLSPPDSKNCGTWDDWND